RSARSWPTRPLDASPPTARPCRSPGPPTDGRGAGNLRTGAPSRSPDGGLRAQQYPRRRDLGRGERMTGFVLGPQEGPAYGFHGATVVIKASGAHTRGQLGVMESDYPSG